MRWRSAVEVEVEVPEEHAPEVGVVVEVEVPAEHAPEAGAAAAMAAATTAVAVVIRPLAIRGTVGITAATRMAGGATITVVGTGAFSLASPPSLLPPRHNGR